MSFKKVFATLSLCGGMMLAGCSKNPDPTPVVSTYTVSWVVEGKTVETDTGVKAGEMPHYDGATPQKAATAEFTYTFKGWTPELAAVTKDVTYTAEFTSAVNTYTIEFKNGDEVLQSSKVAYGETPVYSGKTPVKSETEDYTYTFKGWSPEVAKVTCDATYTATFDEVKKITDKTLGYFVGEFYGKNGVLNISKDGATITKGDAVTTLSNKSIEGEGFDTVVTYQSGETTYTVSWSDGDKKFVEVEAGETVAEFMPSIASIQGWYTGYGDAYIYNIVYIVSNEFDEELGFFNVGAASASYGTYSIANYAKSYFAVVNNEVKLGWDFYSGDDLTEAFSETYAERQESGKIDLMYYDYDDFLFESSVSVFNFTFFKPEELSYGLYADGLSFNGLDEESQTVYIGWDEEPSAYVEGYDANGSYVAVGNMKIYGSRYGAFVETADGKVEMPFYNVSDFYEIYDVEFSDAGSTISYTMDWDTYEDVILIDGEASDTFEFDIYNRELVIKATKGDDVYYVIPHDGDETLKVIKNNVSIIYINENIFKPLYVRDYFMNNGMVFSVDSSLVIHVSILEINASLKYTDDYGVVLVFDGEKFGVTGDMYLINVEEDYGLYIFFNPADTSQGGYLFDKAYVEGYYGDWTSGKMNITISNTGVTSEDTSLISGLKFNVSQTIYGDLIPFIYAGGDYALALFGDQGASLYTVSLEEGLVLVGSFVPKAKFDAIVGKYKLNEKYGVETVSLSADGTLIIDTLNSTGDGIVPVEYDYSLYLSDGKVCARFTYKDYPVSVKFDGEGHCSIFDVVYLSELYFDNQGAYTDGTNIISVVDNVIKYNEKLVTVTSITDNTVVGTVDGKDVEIVFNGTSASVTIEGNTSVLNKSAYTLASFITKATNVSDLGYDVEVKADGIYWGMTGTELYKVSSYEYALDGGEVVIKFSNAGIDYTIKIVGGEVVVTGKSNIPPLPPII